MDTSGVQGIKADSSKACATEGVPEQLGSPRLWQEI
jgi:hypothetical protein